MQDNPLKFQPINNNWYPKIQVIKTAYSVFTWYLTAWTQSLPSEQSTSTGAGKQKYNPWRIANLTNANMK